MKKSIYVMLFGIAMFILAYILRTKEVKDELNEEEPEEEPGEEPQPKPKSRQKTEPVKAVIIEPKPIDNENAGNE